MKLLALIFLLVSPAFSQDAALEKLSIPGFSGGVVSRYSPILIPDSSVQYARNVYFDELGISRRKGYSQFNSSVFPDSSSVRGIWPFTADDGTRYILALSSQTIYKAPTTGVFSGIAGLSGLSAIAEMDATAYLGKIWFANGVDPMAYWTGASTKTVTDGPLGSMIEGWRNRIVTAGVAGSLSYVFMSRELDGETWATGPTLSESPVAIAFGGFNAKPIKCVYGGFKDFLMVANEDETYGVYGFGRNDFVVRTLSREVGCIEDKSVQEKDGALYWMSRRGIEKMTTQGGISRVSDGVKDVFDTIINNTAQNRIKLYSTQAQWESGNLYVSGPGAKMSATISPGSVVPSTWSHTDDDYEDWILGTLDNTTTSYADSIGSVSLTPDISSRTYDTFTDLSRWTFGSGTNYFSASLGNLRYITPTYGFYSGEIYTSTKTLGWGDWQFNVLLGEARINGGFWGNELWYYFISDSSGTLNSNSNPTLNGYVLHYKLQSSWNRVLELQKVSNGYGTLMGSSTTVVVPIYTGQYYYKDDSEVKINVSSSGVFTISENGVNKIIATDSGFSKNPSSFNIFKVYGTGYMPQSGFSGTDAGIDNLYIPGTFPSSGTFTSPIFDTTLSTPVGGPFEVTFSTPAGTALNFYIRESTKNISYSIEPSVWSDWISVADSPTWFEDGISTSTRIPFTKEYWQYKTEFSTIYSTRTPILTSATLIAATTGTYIHECADTSGAASWGNFQANSVLDGGSISYYITTGNTCDSVQRATATWTAQNNNAPITLSTANYTGIKEIFTIDSGSSTALLRDVTLNWLEGVARPPVASSIFNERYYMAYTTSSANSINDFMYVADKNDAPTFLDDINCYSLALFNRRFYCGDANATGKIYQLETGESDNGRAFTSAFKTKAYSFGDPDAEKEFVKMYAAFAPSSDSLFNINITPSYRLDLSTSTITLSDVNTGEDPTAGMLVAKIPFAVNNNLTGRFLDVSFSNTSATSGWTLFGLSMYFRRMDVK